MSAILDFYRKYFRLLSSSEVERHSKCAQWFVIGEKPNLASTFDFSVDLSDCVLRYCAYAFMIIKALFKK